jgi:energy-coupling factor transporter ATP-binding protein EcfA2
MTGDGQTPDAIYAERRERFAREAEALEARWNRVANLRLAAFLAAVACIGWGIRVRGWFWIGAGALLLIGFLVLVRHHVVLGRARRRALEFVAISVEAGGRRRRDWGELPLRSGQRAEAEHPYAADLDIFGRASLFHLLFPGGTALGERTLRDWLLAASTPEVVRERQRAVADLAPRIDLRDDLVASGRLTEGASPDPAPFLRWAEGEPWLMRRGALLWAARIMPPLFWLFLGLWLAGIVTWPIYLLCLLAIEIIWRILGRRTMELLATISAQQRSLQHFAASFAVLDGVEFDAPLLARLQADLSAEGVSAYRQMRRLAWLGQFVIPPSAGSHGLLQRLCLWDVHALAALERWQRDVGGRVRRWLVALGEIEALAALAGLAHAQPAWTMPAIEPEAAAIEATALGHPLLADEARVANDVAVGPPGSFLLVTGSNMSGKSTLLRAIGTNLVLAGAGGPVCAAALRLPPVVLWTSMRIEDSLAQGVSYYLAELRRLKAIVDAARAIERPGEEPRLCYLLDEMLQGTNTAERQIAARRIIGHLVRCGAIGAVSTHDLNLADASPLAEAARTVHFTEQFASGPEGTTMTFDYQLRPGIATSTNALKLMEMIGLTLRDEE